MKNPSTELLSSIAKDRTVRQNVTRESHLFFFLIYFPHYVKYEIAPFQDEIFDLTQDASKKLVCIVAFRGSAKSTIVTFSYTLWAILGVQNKKYVLIVCQTRAQAKQHMMNIRHELETNALLKSDLGPFREENDTEWASSSLVFENVGARITIASLEQSIRGFKHNQYRPDLIILDDKRMPYPETTRTIRMIAKNLPYEVEPLVVIESNGFQEIYADQLAGSGVQVGGIKNTTDKRSRLAMTSHYIQTGIIKFPRNGAEELINQLTGFGIEGHDDLADAFAMAVIRSLGIMEDSRAFDVWENWVKENGGMGF